MPEAIKFEDLRILQSAEAIADGIWREVVQWDSFQVQDYASQLTSLARQLNAFATGLKSQRHGTRSQSKAVHELSAEYVTDSPDDALFLLFTDKELAWLATVPNP